ncbi:hypothetical protein [Paenibacillus sp. PL91]|uniref:hypothetical protein n=1 Tax=Paenibacillus sp. PL91 TaxID=2729538 RepID=UPI00145F5CE8|nr:hypothetical protein [Paenibacillus sp. PL91]MBC9204772.1 hypothetical protein [Paenibacillus sp. PL91]
MKEKAKSSKIFIDELFYKLDDVSTGRIITFSSPLNNGQFIFGLDDDNVPDLLKEMTNIERIHEHIKFLHWYTPESIVEHICKELVGIENKYLSLLFQPLEIEYWDNAALVLSRIEH